MKNPTKAPITRESLLTTASYNNRWFASLLAGSAVLGTSALHAALWDGSESRDWNTAGNWNTNAVPGQNADINTDSSLVNIPLISADLVATPVDIQVGVVNAGATPGSRLDHTAGNASTGSQNWMIVGARNAGSKGTYNLSNPAGTGGIFTGHGIGSGNMTVGGTHANNGNLYVGGDDAGGDAGTGVVNVNTSGTLTIRNDLFVGNQGGNGTLNLDNGTITSGNVNDGAWTAFGFTGGTGTLNMSGGTLISYGALWVPRDTNSDGVVNLRGGVIETRTHGEGFVIGEGATTTGIVTHTGGTINTNTRDFTVGRNGGGTATYTINTTHGASSTVCARFLVATGSGTIGTANLDGGSLTTAVIDGGDGNGTVNFNGTQINATGTSTNFLSGLTTAEIKDGGLLLNTGNFSLTVPQALSGGNTGSLVKTGTGTLILTGASSYTGTTAVNAGSLVLNTNSTGGGALSVANSSSLTVNALSPGAQLVTTGVTFGTSTLNASLGDVNGTNPTTSLIDVTGPLVLNGNVTVNVTGSKFVVGDIPLITYNAAQKSGIGTFPNPPSLPPGVVATLVTDDNYFGAGLGAVYLDITSVALPKWTGVLVNRFTTGSPSTASNDVTDVANVTGIAIGNTVSGPGIAPGTTVTAITGNTVTLSLTPTADGTNVNLMFVAGPGTNPGVWDTATPNWVDQITGASSTFATSNPATFDDDAPGSTTVTKSGPLLPSLVTFDNSVLTYTLTGAGTIDGATSLVKKGSAETILDTNNSYDGPTRIEGGTLTVATLLNPGNDSPIGNNSQLVIAGGFLNYTGADLVTTRGLTLDGTNGGLRANEDITLQGQVTANVNGSNFRKQGTGTLTLTHGGANALSSNNQVVDVEAGTLVLDGTAGGQVNTINGELWVATEPDVPANLTVTNTTLNISSWLAVGRGNGNDGVTNINVSGSTVQTGNVSTGFNNGLTDNASEATISATNSTWTNAGVFYLAESANSTGTLSLNNANLITNTGITELSRSTGTTSTVTIDGTSEMRVDRFLMGIGDTSTSNVTIQGSGKLTKTGGSWLSIGNSSSGQGTLTVKDSGTLAVGGGDFNVADTGTSKGTLNIQGNAVATIGGPVFLAKNATTEATLAMSGGSLTVTGSFLAGGADGQTATPKAKATITQTGGTITLNGDDNRTGGTGTAEWNISAGSVVSNGWMTLGRYAGGTGTMNASGGTVTQNHANRPFRVAEIGTGVLNVSGTAVVSAPNAGGFSLGGPAGSSGTINVNGGTLVANRIYAGGADGTSNLVLNGGILQAATGANLDWVSGGLDSVLVGLNNAFIDTNGQTVAINKPIDDGGGNVTKQGAGTLLLNGASSYLGTTTVAAGALGGSGSLGGPLQVDAAASVNPGLSTGTLTGVFAVFESVDLDGTYVCEIDGANADQLEVAATLTIAAGAKLDFNALSAPTAPVYIIAKYDTLDGTFAPANITDLPSGYSLDYNYQSAKQIALVQTATPFGTWIAGYPSIPVGDRDPGDDPDGDGNSNQVEFALGGTPNNGSDNAKIYSIAADSDFDNPDTSKELLLTMAVRNGTGTFTGTTSKSAASDDPTYGYTVQGSTDLVNFNETVNVVPIAVPPAGVTLPAGYTWKTFSLQGSNGLPSKGFLRVLVTP